MSKLGSDQEGVNKWITQGFGGVTDVRGSDGGKKGSIVNKCGFLVPSHTQLSYCGWLNVLYMLSKERTQVGWIV